MIKGVIFDMDGVMIDSERQSTEGWLWAAGELGVQMPMWLIDSFKGAPAELSAKMFDDYYKGTIDFWEMRQMRTDHVYEMRAVEGIPVKPGLHKLLDYIRQSGLKCAVATSTRKQSAENSLHVIGAWDYLDAVVYGDEVENGKPAPDIFLHAANAIGIEPEECIVIEDSINGIKAGFAANMTVIHVPDTITIGEDIRALTAVVCDELGDIVDILKDWNSCGIDRNHVKAEFASYVSDYNAEDDKVKLKIDHTYRVAAICERIARSLRLDKKDVELAWLLGMFHDIGRFEQLRQYGTFYDAVSVDHAALSADILFKGKSSEHTCCSECSEYAGGSLACDDSLMSGSGNSNDCGTTTGEVGRYVDLDSQWICRNLGLMESAVRSHNMYRIPEGLTERETMFANILRDADKLDILKVCVEEPVEAVYAETEEALKTSKISEEVMEAFFEEKAVLKSLRKSAVDKMVGHILLVFELVYPVSIKIAKEQGHLDKLLHFCSKNEGTNEQLSKIREKMNCYMSSITG